MTMIQRQSDLYQVLQVIAEAEPEVIQAAYRALVKRYHPDTGRFDASNEKMKALNEAFAVLGDPQRRKEYNLRRQEDLLRSGKREQLVPAPEEAVLRPAPGVEIRLVRVPAGPFLMGHNHKAAPQLAANDSPQHAVTLPDYYIGKHPITVAQYAVFVSATGYMTTAEQEGDGAIWQHGRWTQEAGADWRHPNGPDSDIRFKSNHPVSMVSWEDGRAFCRWVSEQTGTAVRLPTEAEWEKAARGTDGRPWPWGAAAPDGMRLNLGQQGHDTLPVGNYSPQGDSPYGCADMLGANWEWTHSIHQAYPYSTLDGREDPGLGYMPRVLRGGPAWLAAGASSVTARDARYPVFRAEFTGFRVCTT